MRFAITLSALLVCAAASAGEVYKWKDKDGRVHYGDQPKHDAEAVSIDPRSGEPSEGEAARLARESECKAKQVQLENYKKAPSISEVDNLGKQREYTPAEREQFLVIFQKKVDEACSPPTESAGTPAQPPATN